MIDRKTYKDKIIRRRPRVLRNMRNANGSSSRSDQQRGKFNDVQSTACDVESQDRCMPLFAVSQRPSRSPPRLRSAIVVLVCPVRPVRHDHRYVHVIGWSPSRSALVSFIRLPPWPMLPDRSTMDPPLYLTRMFSPELTSRRFSSFEDRVLSGISGEPLNRVDFVSKSLAMNTGIGNG